MHNPQFDKLHSDYEWLFGAPEGEWKPGNEQLPVRIRLMEDSHIQNCMKMIENTIAFARSTFKEQAKRDYLIEAASAKKIELADELDRRAKLA